MLLSKIIRDLKLLQQRKGDVEVEKIISEERFEEVCYNEDTRELEFYSMPF